MTLTAGEAREAFLACLATWREMRARPRLRRRHSLACSVWRRCSIRFGERLHPFGQGQQSILDGAVDRVFGVGAVRLALARLSPCEQGHAFVDGGDRIDMEVACFHR